MGVMQMPLGKTRMSGQLKLPFIATIAVLFIIWSLASLDMPSLKPMVDVNVEPSIQHENGGLEAPIPDGNKLPTEGSVTELTNETVSEGRPVSERPLVLYAYADSESHSSLVNLKFFIQHGLHDAADFIFILNGETTAGFLIPQEDNIRVVQRANDCYDLGAYAEILTTNDLYKGYKKFIMLNASIRGPFLPSWSNTCWMDMYLGRVTDEVKLVGMTANCWPTFHIQSMIWATDIIGLTTLLFPPDSALEYLATHPVTLPKRKRQVEEEEQETEEYQEDEEDPEEPEYPKDQGDLENQENQEKQETQESQESEGFQESQYADEHQEEEEDENSEPQGGPDRDPTQIPGINGCFHSWNTAVAAEISSTSLINAAGYKVEALMAAYHGMKSYEDGDTCSENKDVLWNGEYFGTNVHVFETGFLKSNRDVDPVGLERQTEWMSGRRYTSYDYCHAA